MPEVTKRSDRTLRLTIYLVRFTVVAVVRRQTVTPLDSSQIDKLSCRSAFNRCAE